MKATAFIFVLLLLAGIFLPGCSKEQVLGVYDGLLQSAGSLALTSGLMLKGDRTYGEDHYTGTYKADYINFSGEEVLFGGTALEQRKEEAVAITCTLRGEGTAEFWWNCGANTAVLLLSADGVYTDTLYLAPGSNYFSCVCDGFTGSIALEIQ